MPRINVLLPDITQSVTRPVIFDIINQLKPIMQITDDTEIYYPGDIQKAQTFNSGIDKTDDKFAKLATGNYNYIEVTEDYDREAMALTSINGREHTPIFLDPKLNVFVAPIYGKVDVTINFKHVFNSKTLAVRWRDNIRQKISSLRDINLHDITYHYLLPVEILLPIRAIHTNREKVLPYNQSFEEYLKSHCSNRLSLVSDLVNSDARLAISETQTRIVGTYGFDGLPDKPEREDSDGTWIMSYSYKFSYEKPLSCFMKYPIIVHNNLLPIEFTKPKELTKDASATTNLFSSSIGALNIFEADSYNNLNSGSRYMLRLPEFDDYIMNNVPSKTGSIFLALCQVDEDNRSLLNLNELGSIVLDNDILDFIKNVEYPYINSIYKSILNISLYRDNDLMSGTIISCNNNLLIKANNDLDLRKQYRVRLSILTDLSLLRNDAILRLRKYPKALVKIIGAINELLRNNPDFINLGDKSSISDLEFNAIYRILNGYNYNNISIDLCNNWYGNNKCLFNSISPLAASSYRNNKVNFNTVMTSGIVAIKHSV